MPKIIKSGDSGEIVKTYTYGMDFSREDGAEDEAERRGETDEEVDVLDEAVIQAREILDMAHKEAEKIKEDAAVEGRREGYEEGYEAGCEKAYQDNQDLMNRELTQFRGELKDLLESVAQTKKEILDKYLEDLKMITAAVAEKVIHTSLQTSGEVIKRMILSATEKLKKTQWVKIYVDKNDMNMALDMDSQLAAELVHLSDNIKIIRMDSQEEGTCIIEMPEEIIDASVNTQMENIKSILNNARL